MASLEGVAAALQSRPAGNVPLVVFESTLAPSSMTTVIRSHFAAHGLVEGRDVLLGNSPNRVMPGRLVERVRTSDKIVGGLHPLTPTLIAASTRASSPRAPCTETNSMTAEVVKTLENAYRDVRIAYSAEIVALLRRARHRLLRGPRRGQRAAGAGRRGVRRPERRAERRDARADGRRRRALPAEGRYPPLVACDRGRRRHVAQPDPRRAPRQRRLARPRPSRLAERALGPLAREADRRDGSRVSVQLRGHAELAVAGADPSAASSTGAR